MTAEEEPSYPNELPEDALLKHPNELPEDPLIKQLVSDPTDIPNLIVLVGFLGRNSRDAEVDDGYRRLYLTPTLNDYITFERAAVVHHRPLSPEQSPAGGSMVWLKRDTTVQRTRIESRQMQAEFLQGKMIDNARMSKPSFPKGSGDECGCKNPCTCSCTCCTARDTIDGCPPSIAHC